MSNVRKWICLLYTSPSPRDRQEPHPYPWQQRGLAALPAIDPDAGAPAGAKAPAAATWPDFSDGNLGPDSKDDNLGPDST